MYHEITLRKTCPDGCNRISTLYIGSPIDQARGVTECFKELADAVLKADNKITIFNPLTAYCNAQNAVNDKQINFVKNINETAISTVQAAAFAWRNQPSYGVPLEMDYFSRVGKPFFVCNLSGKKLGLYMQSAIMQSLGFESNTLEEMTAQIAAYNSLSHEPDFYIQTFEYQKLKTKEILEGRTQ